MIFDAADGHKFIELIIWHYQKEDFLKVLKHRISSGHSASFARGLCCPLPLSIGCFSRPEITNPHNSFINVEFISNSVNSNKADNF